MKYAEIVKHVQSAGQIDSLQAAEQAIQATLETLSERMVGDEASHLAAQLPDEIGQYLRGHEGENGERFSLQEFYERVAQRAGVEPTAVPVRVKAVMSTLNATVTPGEFADVRANLSADYEELFPPSGETMVQR